MYALKSGRKGRVKGTSNCKIVGIIPIEKLEAIRQGALELAAAVQDAIDYTKVPKTRAKKTVKVRRRAKRAKTLDKCQKLFRGRISTKELKSMTMYKKFVYPASIYQDAQSFILMDATTGEIYDSWNYLSLQEMYKVLSVITQYHHVLLCCSAVPSEKKRRKYTRKEVKQNEAHSDAAQTNRELIS